MTYRTLFEFTIEHNQQIKCWYKSMFGLAPSCFFFFVKRGTTIHWISFFRSFSLVLLHANNRTRYWRGEFCIELPSNQKAKKIGNVSWIPVPAVTNINNSILSPNSEVFLQISNFTLQLWKSSNIIWQLHGNLKASLKQIYHCRQMSQRRRLQINWNRPSKKVNGDRLYQLEACSDDELFERYRLKQASMYYY